MFKNVKKYDMYNFAYSGAHQAGNTFVRLNL